MEEQKSVQLEFRTAEGPAGENGLVIAERQEAPQRGPDGRFLEGNTAGSKKLTAAQREALEELPTGTSTPGRRAGKKKRPAGCIPCRTVSRSLAGR